MSKRLWPTVALLAVGCAPESHPPVTGRASLTFDCPIFDSRTGSPQYGSGIAQVDFQTPRDLAQGVVAFAVDAQGNETADPAQAVYFGVQVFQSLSPSRLEVFELRVLPSSWQAGEIPLDQVNAIGLLGRVDLDPTGQASDAVVEAQTTAGILHLLDAGRLPSGEVRGWTGVLGLETPP